MAEQNILIDDNAAQEDEQSLKQRQAEVAQKVAAAFEDGEPDFPLQLSKQKAKAVRETISAIEASTESPELITAGKRQAN